MRIKLEFLRKLNKFLKIFQLRLSQEETVGNSTFHQLQNRQIMVYIHTLEGERRMKEKWTTATRNNTENLTDLIMSEMRWTPQEHTRMIPFIWSQRESKLICGERSQHDALFKTEEEMGKDSRKPAEGLEMSSS